MSLPPSDWQRALSLFDEALSLPPDARDAWLAQTIAREPAVSPLLQKLLGAHRRVETNDILATLPRQPDMLQSETAGTQGQLIGPFELIEPIGQGGMGSVWRARYADGRLKRDVAVKLPAATHNLSAFAALRERFARERDFLAQLEHPNIARLYDTGISDGGQPYLAMEYVAGEPIDAYCDKHRLTIKARLRLYLQVLDAVEFAHRQLVLHRDLKPGNVLVDGNGQARLLDFGVAKLLPDAGAISRIAPSITKGTDLTEMAGAAITLAYAAPEQISNGRLSTATDVYALGVMLYRLLTGSAPYQPKRDTRGALEDEVLTVTPTNASIRFTTEALLNARQTTEVALRRTLAGDLDTILAKALKKNPDERYATVAALAEDLRRHLAQQPIAARPDSAWYRGNRFVARHRIAVVASALGVAVLVATTGVAVWQANVATASAVRASKEAARSASAQKFLAGIFANADPEKNKGASVTAREILDRGRARAEKDLASDPEALALVLAQIADIYSRLGLPEDSLDVQRRRVAVVESTPAVDANSLADAQLALGYALSASTLPERNVEAMSVLISAHQRAVANGASAERIVLALCSIADQYRNEKRLPEARVTADEALAYAKRSLPDPSKYLATAYATNAVIARDQGRIADAREKFKKTIEIDATGHGRGAMDSTDTFTFLAQLEHDASDYIAAANQAIAAIRAVEREFGDVRINLAPPRRIAVFAAERSGDLALAEHYVNELLPTELSSGQPMRVATAHLARGRVAMSTGRLLDAESDFMAAWPVLDKHLLWRVRLNVLRAELALRQNKSVAALSILEETLQRQLPTFSANHPDLASTYEWLAVAEARLGRRDAARTHIDLSCKIRSLTRAINHPQRVRCDAYETLLDPSLSRPEKANKVRSLADVVATDRRDRITLIPSLRKIAIKLEMQQHTAQLNENFPILE